ncbi:hypothetical protein Glove_174g44 [Diversispora epigaea]|uniref:G-protein coupled receptors family 1 profile domain-containing protein n=1 Tax=Diversispora epigaea TaxID=1348612 RepID=A0A397IP24_9GLOM|nr:hypothetical protein Glove_174g44 [Diversispora epigaea]
MPKLYSSIFLNFLFVLFLLVPLTKAYIVDESYTPYQDVFDALLNTFFPITFIVLFNVSKTGPIKRMLLPLFDDILYNTIAWVFPLIAFLSYDFYIYLFPILYLSIVAGFHIFHSVLAIKKRERIDDLHNSEIQIFNRISISLIISLAVLIPGNWIVFILIEFIAGERHGIYAINIIYLTRSVSYFNDRIPGDFLVTSNAIIHYYLRTLIDKQYRENQDEENQENQENKVADVV